MSQSETFIVCPFEVVIDTREQSAYDFRGMKAGSAAGKKKGASIIVGAERGTLKTGDYSIKGLEDRVVVERKEKGDFFGCCGVDRERFEQQLSRLNEMEHGVVVVEADWMSIKRGHEHSNLAPRSIHRSVIAWQQDYFPNVHWWMCPGKHFAEMTTFRILARFNEKNGNGQKI